MWDFDVTDKSPLLSKTQSFSTSPVSKKVPFDKRKITQMIPKKSIKGVPGIRKYYLLNDKIHVLAEDDSKILTKWNITTVLIHILIQRELWKKTMEFMILTRNSKN
jgi:hypothetical protein